MIPPHEYSTEVEVRFILLTRDKPQLLKSCLESLDEIKLDGSHAELHIWIDRKELDGKLDLETERIAKEFKWSKGPWFVHIHHKYVGWNNQWISSWRPQRNSSELAIFVEDHVSVSPYLYRWVKAIHHAMGNRTDVSGYCPTGAGINSKQLKENETLYVYQGFSTPAFVPHPARWREFQNWFWQELPKIKSGKIFPYIPDEKFNTVLYRLMETEHKGSDIWQQWYTYYCYRKNLWSVNPHIENQTFAIDHLHPVWEDVNSIFTDANLAKKWNDTFLSNSDNIKRISYHEAAYHIHDWWFITMCHQGSNLLTRCDINHIMDKLLHPW